MSTEKALQASSHTLPLERFVVLDAWRGIAALMVAITRLHADTSLFLSPFIRHAYLFVDFFFVLSGFVIAYAYGHKVTNALSGLTFMIRRFGRLWPLHVSLLGLFVAGEAVRFVLNKPDAFTGTRAPITILADFTLTESLGFFDVTRWNTPSWSISTEFWAYATFAVVWLLGGKLRHWISFVIIAAGLWVVTSYSPTGMDVTFRFGLARCLAGFFTGVLVHALWLASKDKMRAVMGSAMELGALALCFAFVWFAGREALSFAAPLVFAVMVYIFAFEGGIVSKNMQSRPFHALGEWSYSIYMTALAVALGYMGLIKGLEKLIKLSLTREETVGGVPMILVSLPWGTLTNWGLTALYLASVLFVSALTFRWIEAPSRRWFNAKASSIGQR